MGIPSWPSNKGYQMSPEKQKKQKQEKPLWMPNYTYYLKYRKMSAEFDQQL